MPRKKESRKKPMESHACAGKTRVNNPPMGTELLERARNLRAEQTEAEQLLWLLLRDRRLCGLKFRRQHPIAPYTLDFYCHEERLGIELDGGQHNEPDARLKDEKRTKFLSDKGIKVIRFWNSEVLQETEAVLEQLYNSLTPAPLPGGEGI